MDVCTYIIRKGKGDLVIVNKQRDGFIPYPQGSRL